MEEISGSTLTKYLTPGGGLPTVMRAGSTAYPEALADDGLSSVSEGLNAFGNVNFEQLFTPYGSSRYSSGTSPTTKAFTGQRADSASGLDYDNARFYDPVADQFTENGHSAPGFNREMNGLLPFPTPGCYPLCELRLSLWAVLGRPGVGRDP